MNIHQLIQSGLLLASDEGADIIVVLDNESGDLIAYTGKEGDYRETERGDLSELPEEADLDEIEDEAQAFLDELVNVPSEAIEGEAEEVKD